MHVTDQAEALIKTAVSEGKTPLRWIMPEAAVARLENFDPHPFEREGDKITFWGVPVEIGTPAGDVDLELITAVDAAEDPAAEPT